MISFLPSFHYPIEVGVCFSERSYNAEMKRRRIKQHTSFMMPDAAACFHVFDSSENPRLCIICMDGRWAKGMSPARRCGLFAHESQHVLQELHRLTREETPGDEMEAYFVQYIVEFCVEEYEKFRHRK